MRMRVFSMPEEFRGKPAVLRREEHPVSAPEPAPLIIPFALPPEKEEEKVQKKGFPAAFFVLVSLVLLAGGGGGVWWFLALQEQANTETIEEEAVPDPEPAKEQPPETTEPYPGIDTDTDGLTNVEELLYGTDFRSPDTDGDTFLDGNEVFHRYDPNGSAPSTLLDTGAVRIFEHGSIPFTTFYPASWAISVQTESASVVFRSLDGATITLMYEAKDALTTLEGWMKEEGNTLRETEETMTKQGYSAISAEDGRVVYVDLGVWAITARYDLGKENESIEFLQTFKMMMNSVDLAQGEQKDTP